MSHTRKFDLVCFLNLKFARVVIQANGELQIQRTSAHCRIRRPMASDQTIPAIASAKADAQTGTVDEASRARHPAPATRRWCSARWASSTATSARARSTRCARPSPRQPARAMRRRRAMVLGVLSIILWALVLIVTCKYVLILLRADNKGEGGTLTLVALAQRAMGRRTPHRACSSASRARRCSTATRPSRRLFRCCRPLRD